MVIEDQFDIAMVRGTLSASSIAFDNGISVLEGSGPTNRYRQPSIAISGANKIAVAAFHNDTNFPEIYRAEVGVSDNNYDAGSSLNLLLADQNGVPQFKSWSSSGGWTALTSLGNSEDAKYGVCLSLNPTSGELVGLWSNGSGQVKYKTYLAGTWSTNAKSVVGLSEGSRFPVAEEMMSDSFLSILGTRLDSPNTSQVYAGAWGW